LRAPTPNSAASDPTVLALAALAATLGDERRAHRFVDMTGIGTDELRARAAEPALLAALIGFLEAHEPDLIAVAEGVGATPEQLIAARRALDPAQE
jgi:hypothetical protein